MKNIKFLLALFTIVVIAASCATTQGAMDDEYINDPRAQQVGNRVYLQDPYYGTVILERDPFTGRYYDVTYGTRYGSRYSGSPYGGNRVYRYNNRGGNYNRGGNIQIQPQQQTPSRKEVQQSNPQARRKILGN